MGDLTGLSKLTEQGGPLSLEGVLDFLAVPDTSAAWAVFAHLAHGAGEALKARDGGETVPVDRPANDSPEGTQKAEAAAARLLNASADTALALLATDAPSPATLRMMSAVAKLMGALAVGPELASNTCPERRS